MTIKKMKLNTAAIDSQDLQKKMFLGVLGAFVLLLSLYVFFIGRTVFNIIERKSAENEIRTLSANISNLEIEYVSLARTIDMDKAYALGFKESKNTYFASRKSTVGSLTMQADEL